MLGGIRGRRRGWQRMRWLDGITDLMEESEWTPRVGDGQACSDSWGCKESDTTEQLNWTDRAYNVVTMINFSILITIIAFQVCEMLTSEEAGCVITETLLFLQLLGNFSLSLLQFVTIQFLSCLWNFWSSILYNVLQHELLMFCFMIRMHLGQEYRRNNVPFSLHHCQGWQKGFLSDFSTVSLLSFLFIEK